MAGVKGKSGGLRQNSGRKSRAEELGLPSLIEEIAGEQGKKEVLQKVLAQAKEGSFAHQQLFLAYAFGKPQDKVDLTTNGKDLPTSKEIVFRRYDAKP